MTNQVYEKMLSMTKHWGNANQNHNEIAPHTCQNLLSKRTQIMNVGKDMEERELSYTVVGNVNWCSHCGKQTGGFSKK